MIGIVLNLTSFHFKAPKSSSSTKSAAKTTTARRKSMIAKTTETNVVLRTPMVATARRTRRSVAAGLPTPVSPVTEVDQIEKITEEIQGKKVNKQPVNTENEVSEVSSASSVTVVMAENRGLIADMTSTVDESETKLKTPAKPGKLIKTPVAKSQKLQEVPKKTPGRPRKSEIRKAVPAETIELNIVLAKKKSPGRPRKSVTNVQDTIDTVLDLEIKSNSVAKKNTPGRPANIIKTPSKPVVTKKTPGKQGKSLSNAVVSDLNDTVGSTEVSTEKKKISLPRKSISNPITEKSHTTVLQPELPQDSTPTRSLKSNSATLSTKTIAPTTAVESPVAKPKMMAIRSGRRAAPDPQIISKLAENITPEPSESGHLERQSRSRKRPATSKMTSPEMKTRKSEPRKRKVTPNRLMAVRKQAATLDMSMGDNSVLFATPENKNLTRKAAQAVTPYHTPLIPGLLS